MYSRQVTRIVEVNLFDDKGGTCAIEDCHAKTPALYT
jgi:hypothetical protein